MIKLIIVLLFIILFVFVNCSTDFDIKDEQITISNSVEDQPNNVILATEEEKQTTSPQPQIDVKKLLLQNKRKTFKIDQISSNHTLIRDALTSRGYTETKKSKGYGLKWSWCWEMLRVSNENQIVNHFINHDEIGSKIGLTKNMNNLYLNNNKETSNLISKFFPRSYILSNPIQKESFIKDFNRDINKNMKLVGINNDELLNQQQNIESIISVTHNHDHEETKEPEEIKAESGILSTTDSIVYPSQKHIDGDKNIWIVKPASQARGVGIEIFSDLSKLLKHTTSNGEDYIVQKYIESPYTILNTKFDIRQFVLVKSLNPLIIFKFRECYLRFCSIEYSTDNLNDRFVHLSNYQVQKEYLKDHKTPFPENQWPLKTFRDHLIKEKGSDIWNDRLNEEIKSLITTTIKSWPKNGQNKGSYELLGFDVLLNENLDPLLLEVNTNPGLHLLTENVKIHHKIAVDDLFKVILDNDWENIEKNQDSFKNLSEEDQIKRFGQWELIHVGEFDASIEKLPIKKPTNLVIVGKDHDFQQPQQ